MTLLFAEEAAIGLGVFSGVVVAVLTLVVAAVSYLALVINSSSRLMQRIEQLTTQVFKLQDGSLECARREADLKAEVVSLQRRLSAAEKKVGISPEDPLVGVVIADLTGKIRVFSPSLVPLFKYLPAEVVGKPIAMLIPEDLRMKQEVAFRAYVVDEHRHADPTRVILTYALDKLGERIPVAITLDGFQVGAEGLVTATVRKRASGGEPAPAPNP